MTNYAGLALLTYRHLQSQLVLPNLKDKLTSQVMQRSTADIGLDPTSFLPQVLSYSVGPDDGNAIPIAIEIHYADYRAINGVQIPFTIERYVNGTLQLQIVLSSAQVN